MASSPSYGDRPPLQGYRRSFTVPPRVLSFHERAGLDEADADSNILYSHPSARIITFSPPAESIPPSNKENVPDTDYPVDTIETLPWRSRTEMLAATGRIVIEKVRGSGHFLKSADQKVIYTIMRNSQCWCVDGESKFVLRIGKFRYYRIELPSETEADKEKVQELKTVLSKVLRFERTPCPFKRAFHVDLPDDAITPRRKGAWKRKPTPLSTAPNTDPLPLQRTKTARAWSLQGQTTPSPLQTYGRRGSDYGFSASRDPSPRHQYDAGGYRPVTPSSLASSEGASDVGLGESPGQEDVSHRVNLDSTQNDDASPVNGSDSLEPNDADEGLDTFEQHSETGREVPESSGIAGDPSSHVLVTSPTSPQPQETNIPAATSLVVELGGDESKEAENLKDERRIGGEDRRQSVSGPAAVQIHEQNLVPELGLYRPSLELPADSVQEQNSTQDELFNSPTKPTEHLDSRSHGDSRDLELPTSEVEESDRARSNPRDPAEAGDILSRVSSVESFHTTNSLTEELLVDQVELLDFEKTPQTEKYDPFSANSIQHRRELSELTVTASTVDEHSERNIDFRPSTSLSLEEASTPALGRSSASESSWPEVQTPSPLNEGLRRRLNMKRSLSPLPPPTTLFSPSSSPSQGGQFTAAFLQKACNVALVKPIEAVVLLVHILARIAGGATVNDLLSGDLFRRPDQHRRRSSFPDQVSPVPPELEDEDDFGVPLRGRTSQAEVRSGKTTVSEDDADSIFDLD